MGELVDVSAVEVDEGVAEPGLLGANIDSPAAGRRMAAAGLEIGGWALAPSGRPEAVEAVLGGKVIARAIWQSRRDLAIAFPDLPEAEEAGFELAVDVGRPTKEGKTELEIRARVDGSTLPFAKVRLRHCWRGELRAERPPLVSLVVVNEVPQAEDLARTLASIADQRHPLTEVLLLQLSDAGPLSTRGLREDGIRFVSAGPAGVALRNEGVRRSNGELIFFLRAGRRIAPDGLSLAVEMLTRKPTASAIIDGDRGEIAAALYRRSAFEELEGFAETPRDCDLELAHRAKRYNAVFARGALVAAGG